MAVKAWELDLKEIIRQISQRNNGNESLLDLHEDRETGQTLGNVGCSAVGVRGGISPHLQTDISTLPKQKVHVQYHHSCL
jgi:hypothetical protein